MFWLPIILFFSSYLILRISRWLWKKRCILQTFQRQSIPGPKPSFWFGNLPEFIHQPYVMDDWVKKYGNFFGYFHGPKPILVLSDIDDIQTAFVQNGKLFPNRILSEFNVEPFSASVLEVRDKQWRHSRRVLTPPFTAHKVAMDTTKTIINQSVERLLKFIDEKLIKNGNDTGTIDVTRQMNAITLDVICRLAFGMEKTDVFEDDSEIHEMATEFMKDNSIVYVQYAWYFPILIKVFRFMYSIFGAGKFINTMITILNNSIIEYYQRKIKENLNQSNIGKMKMNILDFMLEQKEKGTMNEMEIFGNALVILLGGSDTTATGLAYTLYLLAKDQSLQEQLRKEINASFIEDADDEQIDYCQFNEHRCELLDRVWHESLRLYPPVVSMVTRELETGIENFVLPNTGVKITPEMSVLVPVWTIHHDPEHWPEPYQFNPYRENLPIPDSSDTVKNGAFMPFGLGPRICIGKNLSLSEGRAVLAALIRRYRIELEPTNLPKLDPKTGLIKVICPTVIIYPEKSIQLRFTRINNKN